MWDVIVDVDVDVDASQTTKKPTNRPATKQATSQAVTSSKAKQALWVQSTLQCQASMLQLLKFSQVPEFMFSLLVRWGGGLGGVVWVGLLCWCCSASSLVL